jgi:hypothetical protein
VADVVFFLDIDGHVTDRLSRTPETRITSRDLQHRMLERFGSHGLRQHARSSQRDERRCRFGLLEGSDDDHRKRLQHQIVAQGFQKLFRPASVAIDDSYVRANSLRKLSKCIRIRGHLALEKRLVDLHQRRLQGAGRNENAEATERDDSCLARNGKRCLPARTFGPRQPTA